MLVVPAVATFGLALTDDDLIALVLVTVAIVVVQLWLPRRWRDRTGLL